MADLARIKRNVAKMASQSAPEADIDGYIASEGVSIDDVRNFKPQAQAAAPQSLGDQLSAGFTSGVNAIPIAGPTILGGLEQLKGMVQGRSPEDVAATDQAQTEANPVASTVGTVAGTVLPFAVGGMIPGVGRLLGMTGGLGSRIGLGMLSGAGINAADTAARGGSPQDMVNSGLIGGALGGTLPVIGKGIGMAADTILGRSAPKAVRNVARALKSDQISPADVNGRLQQLGPDAMMMDLGPNLQRQAGGLASVPGEAQNTVRTALSTRRAGNSLRVQDDVAKTIGTAPDIDTLKTQVVTQQSAAAKPLYDAVRDIPVDLKAGNFAFVFGTKFGKQALANAARLAETDGGGITRPTIGLIDTAKQALDDMATAAARQGKNNEARAIRNLTRALTAEADRIAPAYKAARDSFAGHAAVLDAMDQGTAVFSKDMSPAQLRSSLAAMSQSERDGFLQAAQASIEPMMGNAVNDALALRNLFKKGWNEQKLRLILGDKIADDLLARISRQAMFGTTEHIATGNSETAARQAAQAEVAPELSSIPRPQGLTGLVFSAFDAARRAGSKASQPRINSQMAGFHTAGQLTATQVKQLTHASRGSTPALVGPAVPGLLTGPKKPIQITIGR